MCHCLHLDTHIFSVSYSSFFSHVTYWLLSNFKLSNFWTLLSSNISKIHSLFTTLPLTLSIIMVNTLQLIPLRHNCSAITKHNGLCKRRGTALHHGKNYCWMHHRIVDKSYKKPEKVNVDLIKIDSKEDECSICYNFLNDPTKIVITNCNHVFHLECIQKWQNVQVDFRKTCPNCRTRMTIMRSSNKKKKVLMTNMDVEVKIANTL